MGHGHPPRAVSFVGLSENSDAVLEVPTCARPDTGLHLEPVGTWLNNRPARSTPTTAPLSSRVKKPRRPFKPPLVMMYSSASPGIIAREEAVRQPQGLEYERGDGPLVRQTRDLLHDPPGQVVPRLAVGGPGARRRDQLQIGHLRHVAGQGVIPLAGVDDDPQSSPAVWLSRFITVTSAATRSSASWSSGT
jgi:hypothetical protein